MLAHLAAFMLASAAADTPTVQCGIHNLGTCQNTNQLAWDDNLDDALRKFVGNHRSSWIHENEKEIRQVFSVLGGPPDKKVELPSGLLRFSACRHHSCNEKGVVFLTPDETIRAVAVLHFRCSPCDRHYTLSILVPQENDPVISDAKNWADEIIAREKERYPTLTQPELEHIEVLPRP